MLLLRLALCACAALASLRAEEPLRLLGSGTPERPPADREVSIWLSGRTLAAAAGEGAQPAAASGPAPVVEAAEVELLEEITQSILPYPELAAEAAARLARPDAPAAEPPPPGSRRWPLVLASGRDERERTLLALLLVFADRLQRREGIPAAATVAMALHESGYGRSKLAAEHHNYFGLKVGRAAAPFVELPTRELGRVVRANFRAYRDFEAGIEGFAEFLRRYPRYHSAWLAADARGFIATLLRAGYCPEPDYLECIEVIFRRHRLDLLE